MHLIHRCQQGFTTVTLMGVMLVGGLLVAASFAAVQPDIGFTKKDDDSKQAYAAAEAGVDYYLNRMAQDNVYYVKCDQVPSPTLNAVNLEWPGTGVDTRKWLKIPGYQAEYAVELLAVQTGTDPPHELCVKDVPATMVDPKTGTFRIRSTGRARTPTSATDKPPKRSIVVTLRRKAFIDFLWFTDFETADPYSYPLDQQAWAAANCSDYRTGRSSSCKDQDFISVDTFDGPFKTNDSISVCGTPTFGGASTDMIELNGTAPGWVAGCGGASPNFVGTVKHPAGQLPMPASNAELESAADDGYVFNGETKLNFKGTSVDVTNNGTTSNKPLPPSGVIYVKNTGCTTPYAFKQTYAAAPGCGNVYVKGTYNSDITVGADNDIIVEDDFKASDKATVLGGLIANNFVRVYHPVNNWTNSDTDCDNNGGPGAIQIDAAILALNHSFLVDNYYCGNALGTLQVNGAIAQKFRGTVGTHSGGTVQHGYGKDYNYNTTLRFREPPYFVNPTDAPWRIVRQNEQVPAR